MATKLAIVVADFTTQLGGTEITVGGTTGTLQSQVDDDGNNIPDGAIYLTLDGNNSSKEHIYCTKTGLNLTVIQSVSRQGVFTSGVSRKHRVGASVVITDFFHIKALVDLLKGAINLDSSTPLTYDGTASIVSANQLATKAYVDGVAIAGAPDSSTTVKGIVKTSVAPASPTSPIVVGDNDPRVLTQNENDAAIGTSGSPSSSNKFVTNADTTGTGSVVRASVTDLLLIASKVFGDGSDGAIVFDGTTTVLGLVPSSNVYTLTRDIYLLNGVLNAGVTIQENGYRIFDSGNFTWNGDIKNNGGNGGNAVNSSVNTPGTVGAAGAAPATSVSVMQTGGAGTVGAIGTATVNGYIANATNPASLTNSTANAGGTGGAGGTCGMNGSGSGGSSTVARTGTNGIKDLILALTQTTVAGPIKAGTAGGGGGGGGAFTNTNFGNSASGSGGGGGGAGGVIYVVAKNIAGTGTAHALGGNGGNGGAAFNSSLPNPAGMGGGGGGGGGAGGVCVIVSKTVANPITVTVTGGTGGTGGAGINNNYFGETGLAGNSGGSGVSIYFVI